MADTPSPSLASPQSSATQSTAQPSAAPAQSGAEQSQQTGAAAGEVDNPPQDSFLGHLLELRGCVVRSVVALLVLMFAAFPFAGDVYVWLSAPLTDELANQGQQLVAIGVLSPFIIQIMVSFLLALWAGMPYLLFEMWRFVAPGLYRNEKHLILPIIVSSVLLFSAGMAFAYFLVFKVVFKFIAAMTPDGVSWTPDIAEFLSFMIKIFIGFGVAFETPIVVYLLLRTGAVSIGTMRRARPYVIVGSFVVAAIITPPDILSQLLLAIPCWLLYELGMLLAPKPKPAPQ